MSCRNVDVTQTGTGAPSTDLDKLRRIADETTSAAGVSVASKPLDAPGVCQRPSDGSSGTGARMTYSVALDGVAPVQVASRISDLWKQKGSEWFGADAKVDDSHMSENAALVHLYGGGWDLRAEVPLNEANGPYALIATGPCY